jgi:hypothetical protein
MIARLSGEPAKIVAFMRVFASQGEPQSRRGRPLPISLLVREPGPFNHSQLTRRARELVELEASGQAAEQARMGEAHARNRPLLLRHPVRRDDRHLEQAGNSAFEIGRTIYWVNAQLGNSRAELEAWLRGPPAAASRFKFYR